MMNGSVAVYFLVEYRCALLVKPKRRYGYQTQMRLAKSSRFWIPL